MKSGRLYRRRSERKLYPVFLAGRPTPGPRGEWTVTLEEYTSMVMAGKVPIMIPTRGCVPLFQPGRLSFLYSSRVPVQLCGDTSWHAGPSFGHAEFDAEFVIKGNNEKLVQSLCSSDRLRALVTVQPKFQLSIHDDEGWFGKKYPPEVDVLVFDVAEHIRDVERSRGCTMSSPKPSTNFRSWELPARKTTVLQTGNLQRKAGRESPFYISLRLLR